MLVGPDSWLDLLGDRHYLSLRCSKFTTHTALKTNVALTDHNTLGTHRTQQTWYNTKLKCHPSTRHSDTRGVALPPQNKVSLTATTGAGQGRAGGTHHHHHVQTDTEGSYEGRLSSAPRKPPQDDLHLPLPLMCVVMGRLYRENV